MHEYLKVTDVSEPLRKGGPITRHTDAAAFAVFLLDLMTKRTLTTSGRMAWGDLPDLVGEHLEAFVHEASATQLAVAVARGDRSELDYAILSRRG